MGDVIDLKAERFKRSGEIVRDRPPVAEKDFIEKILKLRESLERIDSLLKDLKKKEDEK